ncbi:hypothetical protein KIPB_013698, partial [Kipferlia bialata]
GSGSLFPSFFIYFFVFFGGPLLVESGPMKKRLCGFMYGIGMTTYLAAGKYTKFSREKGSFWCWTISSYFGTIIVKNIVIVLRRMVSGQGAKQTETKATVGAVDIKQTRTKGE